ncbi:phospholipid scramblase 2, partial [Biomphalaria glabrata]
AQFLNALSLLPCFYAYGDFFIPLFRGVSYGIMKSTPETRIGSGPVLCQVNYQSTKVPVECQGSESTIKARRCLLNVRGQSQLSKHEGAC